MRYILGYAGHNWELFAMRSWMVAFLVFADGGMANDTTTRIATMFAALATLLVMALLFVVGILFDQ